MESGNIQERSIQVVALVGLRQQSINNTVMLRSWTKTFAPLLDNKHDIILDKGGGPEYLCCVLSSKTFERGLISGKH